MSFAVGSLVKARGREWVVLPESTDDFLVLRPLGGTEQEMAGVYLPLEGDDVQPATFDLPDPTRPGDFRSCRLLRDAVRLGFRSSAGPFRSFARINVEPRPYQLVPLLMALKLDPVRLLHRRRRRHRQDDRGGPDRPRAAGPRRDPAPGRALPAAPGRAVAGASWRASSTSRPSWCCPAPSPGWNATPRMGQSLFDVYPFVIVSTDYIKSSRRRDDFVRTCPELVIVDEAHTCAFSAEPAGRPPPAPPVAQTRWQGIPPPPGAGHRHAAQRRRGRVSLAAGPAAPGLRGACPRI